ncbi:MAG: beta strand repeat-containing protein, partial [Tumebacillaceae bacterium]
KVVSFDEGTAKLDGADFTSGGTVSAEGAHTLVVTDAAGNVTTVNFTIDKTNPAVTGVEDGKAYRTDLIVTFNEGTATLNGAAFNNGDTVTAEGAYTLVVTDVSGNVTTIHFTIDKTLPVITGITDNGLYNSDQSATFNEGTATLDGVDYTGGTTISTDGHHDLVVTDAAGNASTVHFTIDKTAPTLTKVGTTATLNAGASFTVSFTELLDAASKTNVENAIKASVDGVAQSDLQFAWNDTTFTLVVSNGNATQTATFNVDATATITDIAGNTTNGATILKVTAPQVSGVNNYSIYNVAVAPTFSNATATLSKDGGAAIAFTSGTSISADGTYLLVLTDIAGNKTNVNFTIDRTAPTVGGVLNGKRYNKNVTPRFREGTATLAVDGGVAVDYISGTLLTAPGAYHLVVTDAAGNATTVDFVIDKTAPVASGVANNTAYSGSVIPTCADGDLATTALTKDGATVAGYTLGTPLSLEGHYVLTLTDTAGNVATVNFTIDKTAPKASVSFGANGLSVNYSDTLTTATAVLYLENGDGSETNLGAYVSGTIVTAAGDYRLVVTDAAGNQTQVYFTK